MKGVVGIALSAGYGSFLALGAILIEWNNLTHWSGAAAGQRLEATIISAYAAGLCFSGWVYLFARKTTWAGLLHAGLMLAIPAMAVIAMETGQLASPGRDDPSGWVAADSNFALLILGTLAAFFGILVMCRVFTSGPSPNHTHASTQVNQDPGKPV